MSKRKPAIELVRAYDLTDKDRGYRVLVDRLWPRGIAKEDLAVKSWLKELAPSTALRQWFNHQPERWREFRKRYIQELTELELESSTVAELLATAEKHTVLLIYAAKDTKHNNAVVLREYLLEIRTE